MRIKAIFVVVATLLLFGVLYDQDQTVYAEKTWGKKSISDSKKVWEITFSEPLHEKSEKANTIYVVDQNGRTVATKLTLSSDRKTAAISPKSSYKPGIEYTLIIKKSIRSKDNENLKEKISMPFELSKNEKSAASGQTKESDAVKKSDSPLKISIDRSEYVSLLTVKANDSVKKVTVNGREMQYEGNDTFQLAIAAVKLGDNLRIQAIGFDGKTVAAENFKVEK